MLFSWPLGPLLPSLQGEANSNPGRDQEGVLQALTQIVRTFPGISCMSLLHWVTSNKGFIPPVCSSLASLLSKLSHEINLGDRRAQLESFDPSPAI